MSRKHTKRKRCAPYSPVVLALARENIRKTMRDIAIRAYMTADGAVDRELLSQFAYVIGIGAEVAVNLGHESAKRLHAGLRDLLAMSVDGGRWRADQASRLHEMAVEAAELALEYANISLQVKDGAGHLSARIALGRATMDDVAGAEIYRQPMGAEA